MEGYAREGVAFSICEDKRIGNFDGIYESGTQQSTLRSLLAICLSSQSCLSCRTMVKHLTMQELETGLELIRQSPKDSGLLELIVCRPGTDRREVLEQAELNLDDGLVGDNWRIRGSTKTIDGSPNPLMQINIINSRAAALVAQERARWPLAGDQLFLDLDLSKVNLPVGSRLALGSAVIEVTAPPHLGCKKFVSRFGMDAMKFVNSDVGRELCLRGINARVVQAGTIRVGEVAKKV